MYRIIKFRAWLKEKKEFYDLDITDSSSVWVLNINYDYVLNQYTWLKDKNGKEIYEGDIVTWSDWDWEWPSNPRIAKVEFTPELSFFAINVCTEEWWHKFWFSNFIYQDTENNLEIIGNIYENPELLLEK